jgi:preprotein translocase subunit SecG
MDILRTILTILFAVDCVALAVVIMVQQGKGQGLGALAGSMPTAETYWGKNKGRSKEENLKRITRILAVVFFALAIVLNMNF